MILENDKFLNLQTINRRVEKLNKNQKTSLI